MSGNDYIKFLTEQFVSYMDLPPEEKKKRRVEGNERPSISNRWFGVLPFAFKSIRKKAE
ncbi:YqzE family protein [Oceanobacillus piezotolerans]|uniref:YqzE family protein n=1 Tax=Oceanobacillus piezotolerans TaxID=2448030 RepID=A0A498DAT2_9BACI|nr:YqzE family protein [Oceanobacillus piezotolerans]RLL48091.1 YqzE family protein [Oceanobacillus piezotolerans]